MPDGSWRYATCAGLLKDDTPVEVSERICKRVVVAQSLYLCRRGSLLGDQCVVKHCCRCAGAAELRAGARPRAWKQISGNLFRECVSVLMRPLGLLIQCRGG
jgi:hypothetical protein